MYIPSMHELAGVILCIVIIAININPIIMEAILSSWQRLQSTLNEALLTNYILEKYANTDLAKSVLSESISNFEGTVLRQTLFAAFEKEAASIVDSG